MEDVRLSIRNLEKSFATPVLRRISLSVAAGEIHALVGENGAGKTTLVNILTGLIVRDGGEIELDGRRYAPRRPRDAFEAGVSFAAQELSIVGTLSVAENIALRRLPGKRFVIQRRVLCEQAARLLERVGLGDVSPDTKAGELSLADRQLLELAKALSMDSRLLILDEPTAALAEPQARRFHRIVKALAAHGTSVLYISHRLNDVLQIADSVTVLRDGRVVTTAPAASLSVPDLMEHMSGRGTADAVLPAAPETNGKPVLELRNAVSDILPHAISLTCHRGEIVGVAGLAGAGKSELLKTLFGLVPLRSGRVVRHKGGTEIPIDSASRAIRSGIGFQSEDRQTMGIYPGLSVLENMMMPGIGRVASRFGIVDRARERDAGSALLDKLAIRCDGQDQSIETLSGGNQQKALIARWLHCDSLVLLLDEPTRGVDVATKSAIYALLFDMRKEGRSIVVASSEIEELLTICNRIVVLSDRRLIRQFERDRWSETEILGAAFSGFTGNSPVGRDDLSCDVRTSDVRVSEHRSSDIRADNDQPGDQPRS